MREAQRRRGPEHAEGAEHRGVVQRAAAQHEAGACQMAHRRQQPAVGQGGGRAPRRQRHAQQGAEDHHGRRRQPEDQVPGRGLRDEAGHRAGQHDAHQQAAHHVADHAATVLGLGQVRRVGHQHLCGHRDEADGQHGGEKGRGPRGQRRAHQRQRGQPDQAAHQPARLDEVAQRHDEQQADAVADLREGHDQAGGARRQAQRGADRTCQGLRVVQVGHDEAAGGGQQQRGRRGGAARGGCGGGSGGGHDVRPNWEMNMSKIGKMIRPASSGRRPPGRACPCGSCRSCPRRACPGSRTGAAGR